MTQDLHPTLDALQHMFERDLRVLREEVEATPDPHLWTVPSGVHNAVGTLAIHLCGNLEHFVGHLLGGSGYQRDRDAEFAGTPLDKSDVLTRIDACARTVSQTLDTLPLDMLDQPMPSPPAHHAGRSILFFLIQLHSHLSRHTGQLHYLRRMLG